jgi:TrmH RNA methyltransferase
MKKRPPPGRSLPSANPSRDRPSPSPRPSPREAGEAIYGLRAGLAVIERRGADVLSIAYGRGAREEANREIDEMLQWATSNRVPCREVRDDELARAAGSPHHEGLCITTRPRRWTPAADLATHLVQARGTAVALDRVRNPYNIGAILRGAAFFGVDAALLGAPAPHPALAPDAIRVAEGAAEHLTLARTTDLADTLGRLRAKGVRVVGADGQGDASALGFAFTRPVVLVMGHEREGMSERVRAQCDAIVAIRGSGAIESLNVAVAAGVLFAEMTRGRAPA